MDKLRKFLELDRKVLRFYCIWDDRDQMFGEVRRFILHVSCWHLLNCLVFIFFSHFDDCEHGMHSLHITVRFGCFLADRWFMWNLNSINKPLINSLEYADSNKVSVLCVNCILRTSLLTLSCDGHSLVLYNFKVTFEANIWCDSSPWPYLSHIHRPRSQFEVQDHSRKIFFLWLKVKVKLGMPGTQYTTTWAG